MLCRQKPLFVSPNLILNWIVDLYTIFLSWPTHLKEHVRTRRFWHRLYNSGHSAGARFERIGFGKTDWCPYCSDKSRLGRKGFANSNTDGKRIARLQTFSGQACLRLDPFVGVLDTTLTANPDPFLLLYLSISKEINAKTQAWSLSKLHGFIMCYFVCFILSYFVSLQDRQLPFI